MIGHESRAAGVLELHLGRVDDPAGTHRSGFGGSPTSLTGLLCISAAGTCISKEQMKLQSLRKPQQALPSWRTSFPPVLLEGQHSWEHIRSSRRFLESSDNFQMQMWEELTTGDPAEPHMWEQEQVRALAAPSGEKLREEQWLLFILMLFISGYSMGCNKRQGWAQSKFP